MAVTDVEAVAWDLEDAPARTGRGRGRPAARRDRRPRRPTSRSARGTVADLDADGLVALLGKFADLYDQIGRAGNYAGLRFSVDTADPKIAALMQRVEERSDALVATRLLFFDLEWAALDDASGRRAPRRRPPRRSPATTSAASAATGPTC